MYRSRPTISSLHGMVAAAHPLAAQAGARLATERPTAALDLGALFFADDETLRRHCADALASSAAFC